MSVFGGDSWGREAQYRKRRVDDLIIEGIHGSAYRKLSSGKFACLVCPQRPILDTPLMLSTHIKGSRHRAAESKLKETEIARQEEINKRIALSDPSVATLSTATYGQRYGSANKPLIERAQKAASEILDGSSSQGSTRHKSQNPRSENCHYMESVHTKDKGPSYKGPSFEVTVSSEVVKEHIDYKDIRERELKFTAAGWKRDCHGRWFKDENVEFDSDEEDPNVCFAL